MKKIFVYGSLKSGFFNHYLLAGAEFKGAGKIEGLSLWNYYNMYPIAAPKNKAEVLGEFYTVNEETFEHIVWLEVNSGYDACTIDGETYFFRMDGRRQIHIR